MIEGARYNRLATGSRVLEWNWGDGWKPCFLSEMHRESCRLVEEGQFVAALNKAVMVHIANYGQHPITGASPKYRCGYRIVEKLTEIHELVNEVL